MYFVVPNVLFLFNRFLLQLCCVFCSGPLRQPPVECLPSPATSPQMIGQLRTQGSGLLRQLLQLLSRATGEAVLLITGASSCGCVCSSNSSCVSMITNSSCVTIETAISSCVTLITVISSCIAMIIAIIIAAPV